MNNHLLLQTKVYLSILFTMLSVNLLAQELASAPSQASSYANGADLYDPKQDQKSLSLKDILAAIEQQYKVYFSYDTKVIQDKAIQADQFEKAQPGTKLEEALRTYLSPFNLEFKKLKKDYYMIYQPPLPTLEKSKPTPSNSQAYTFPTVPGNLQRSSAKFLSIDFVVRGQVTDAENGEALPGVNVLIKNTTIGTVTDIEGNYQLSVSDDAQTLVFSSIGYVTEEVEINGQSTISLALMPDIQSLSEVIVVGYGTQEKKDLTGAVSTINSNVIEDRQSFQLSDALQGSLAGVTVTRNSGDPGATSTVRVRGITSLNTNDPLVIVDGVPGIGLNDINPNDVENISVLKDAASQAIYGSRAAAGVILVTTKRAKENTLQVNYDYEYGISSPTMLPKFADAKTYREISNETSRNDGGGIVWDSLETVNYAQLHADSSDYYPDTNWQDLILSNKQTARQRHNISVGYGSERVKTRGSFSYVSGEGLYAHNKYDRFTFRLNNDIKISNHITTNFDIGYKRSNIQDSRINDVVRLSRIFPGVYSAIRSDREWGEGKDGDNPLAQLEEGGLVNEKYNQLSAIIGLTVSPLDGLDITAKFSPVFDFNEYDRFNSPASILRLGSDNQYWPKDQTSLRVNRTNIQTITTQALVTYNKHLGEHHLGFLAGYEEFNTDYEQIYTQSRDLSVNLRSLEFGDPSLTNSRQYASENGLRSYFGRITYDYKGKYLLQTNFRADGSTRFSPEERWGYFPSVSLGWIVSEENFMQDLPLLSFFKLRASYGEVGNERIGADRTGARRFFDFYPYQGIFEPFNTIIYNGNFVAGPAVNQRFLEDRSLVWEKTNTIDVGADIGFFEDKLSVAIDYYKKQTDDILLELDIPNYLGYPLNTITNVGAMEVKGFDFGVVYRNHIGDFEYSVNLNASTVSSQVTNVGGREDFLIDNGTKINIKGYEFGEWFGYQTTGLWQNQEEIDNYGIVASPGDIRLVDQLTVDTNSDGIPDARDHVINEEDRVPLGASLPKFTYGGNISLRYKGFDFSLVFNGIGKHTLRKEGLMVEPLAEGFGNIPANTLQSYWSPYNTTAQNLNAEFPRFSSVSRRNNYAVSDFWLFNGSYLRIKNITLGYSLPKQIIERARLGQLRVYVGLRDYFTFEQNFMEGWDPEATVSSHPIMKTFLFGINVKL